MKLTIEQNQLAKLLSKATGIVERRNTIPILGNVLLNAAGGKLTVTASDLDIEITSSVECDIVSDGMATVSAGVLDDIVKRLSKSSTVSLEYDGQFVHIKSGRSKFKLASLDPSEFPVMASNEYANTANIGADVFANMLDKVKFAMSSEEARYYLNGVYMHNDDAGDLVTVATDGNRLARMIVDCDAVVAGVIIPRKTVAVLCKLLPDTQEDNITLDTSETKIRISCDTFTLVSKVIDGTYPDYSRVIPMANKNTMKVDAKTFSAASNRVSLVADDRVRGVSLNVSGSECTLSVSGASGEAVEDIEVEYVGDPVRVVFNSKYLAEMMAQSEGGEMTVKLGGSLDPAVFTVDGIDGFTGVSMPMRG